MNNFIKKYSLTDFYYCLCIAAKVTARKNYGKHKLNQRAVVTVLLANAGNATMQWWSPL